MFVTGQWYVLWLKSNTQFQVLGRVAGTEEFGDQTFLIFAEARVFSGGLGKRDDGTLYWYRGLAAIEGPFPATHVAAEQIAWSRHVPAAALLGLQLPG